MKIILGDCIKVLKDIEENSIDLIFADPPFNVSHKYQAHVAWKGSGYTSHKGDWDYVEDYPKFTEDWVTECCRVLREGGGIGIIGTYGSLVHAFQVLEKLKMRFQSHIIWHKINPAPSVHRRMLTHANEIILYFTKGSRWTFNYDLAKELNDGKQMHNVWNISAIKKIGGISAKPLKLLGRFVRIFSNESDLVLDPFLGSGTTMVACQNFDRDCIGIEIDEEYCRIASIRTGVAYV